MGYAIGQSELIEGLERVKNSFNSYPLDKLAQAGAIAAIEDVAHLNTISQAVIQSREKLVQDLESLGFKTIPSSANFIFTTHPHLDAGQLAQALREKHIIVRHFKLPRIDQYLRITIGTDNECESLVTVLREILKK